LTPGRQQHGVGSCALLVIAITCGANLAGAQSAATNLFDATHQAARDTLGAWFGSGPVAHMPGIGLDNGPRRLRWLSSRDDVSHERAVIAAVTRQYWNASRVNFEPEWFAEGIRRYSAARVANAVLTGRNYDTRRFFGSFVRYSVRSLEWSRQPGDPRPPVWDFDELGEARPEARRATAALHSIERVVGWPAMQQAIATFAWRFAGRSAGWGELASILGEQSGIDARAILAPLFEPTSSFDYGIASMMIDPETDEKFHTTITVRRFGDAVLTSRALQLVVVFEDGTVIEEWYDGVDDQHQVSYLSVTPAVRAVLDPDVMWLIDHDRTNNALALQPASLRPALGALASWIVWLEDMMVSYSSLL
jgi:hypothetical protein